MIIRRLIFINENVDTCSSHTCKNSELSIDSKIEIGVKRAWAIKD